MTRRRAPLLLSMTAAAAALTGMVSLVSAGATVADHVKAPAPSTSPEPTSRMGAMVSDDLAKRDAAARARAIDLQEQAAKAAAARLQSALKPGGQPGEGVASPPAPVAQPADSPQPDQFDTLARIYQAMKPAKAAPVFEQLDLEVQYLVAKKMRERSAALLMAAMSPQGAARLSMRMAGRPASAAKYRPAER